MAIWQCSTVRHTPMGMHVLEDARKAHGSYADSRSAGSSTACKGDVRSSATPCAGPRGAGTASRSRCATDGRDEPPHGSHLAFVICCAYCVFRSLAFRPKVELSLVWSPTDFHRLQSGQHQSQPWLLKDKDAVAWLRRRRRRARGGTREHHDDDSNCYTSQNEILSASLSSHSPSQHTHTQRQCQAGVQHIRRYRFF